MSSNQKSHQKKGFEPEEWISQAQAAQMRGTTRQAIADLIARGRFETLVIAGKILLKRSEVEEFKPKPPGPAPKAKQPKRRKVR
jgi:hypothetical protein